MTLTRRYLSGFRNDRTGVAALEFAFIVPVLVLTYLGTMSAFDAFRGNRLASIASHTVADLASRQGELDDDDVSYLFAAGRSLLGKYVAGDNYGISLASVQNVPGEGLEVAWSDQAGGGVALEDEDLDDLALPAVPPGESVLVVTTFVTFQPMFAPGALTVDKTAVRNPRYVSAIQRAGGGGGGDDDDDDD